MQLEKFYPESLFGGFTRADGTIAFYTRIRALCSPESVLLNVGCGRGAYVEDAVSYRSELQNIRGSVRRVIGIDVDEAASSNPSVDEFRLITGPIWPIDPNSIDLLYCDQVIEHIEDVETFFNQIHRALRPGGIFCARTPSGFGYVALIARMIPDKFHHWILGNAQSTRQAKDVFPAYYYCNTPKRLRASLGMDRFSDIAILRLESEPSYLEFSRAAYSLGVLHGKIWFSPFRLSLLCFARKC